MSVTFDTSGTHNSATASVSTLSNNFTIGSPTNAAMVGFIAVASAAQITSPSMTWNAVSMTSIASTAIFDAGAGSLILFGLVAPTSGTHSLSASWTGAGPASIGFWTFGNVNQTGGATTFKNGNTVNNGGSSTSQTLVITTTNGNGTVAGWGSAVSFTGTQTPTQDWQDNSAGNMITEGQHILSSSGSSSFTTAISSADFCLGTGCDILASSAVDTLMAAIWL